MDRPQAPLDISEPEAWAEAYAALSDALSAVAFAHPACARAEIRLSLADGSLGAKVENMRRARMGGFEFDPLGDPSLARELAQASMPPQAAEQAASLAELMGQLGREAKAALAGDPAFAAALGPTLGLGLSERWDPDHSDGVERAGEGLEAFESAILSAAGRFPSLALNAARAACHFHRGEAQACAQSALAELEAEGLRSEQAAPERRPSRGARSL